MEDVKLVSIYINIHLKLENVALTPDNYANFLSAVEFHFNIIISLEVFQCRSLIIKFKGNITPLTPCSLFSHIFKLIYVAYVERVVAAGG